MSLASQDRSWKLPTSGFFLSPKTIARAAIAATVAECLTARMPDALTNAATADARGDVALLRYESEITARDWIVTIHCREYGVIDWSPGEALLVVGAGERPHAGRDGGNSFRAAHPARAPGLRPLAPPFASHRREITHREAPLSAPLLSA